MDDVRRYVSYGMGSSRMVISLETVKQKQRKVVSGDIQDEGATPSTSTINTLLGVVLTPEENVFMMGVIQESIG